ncbi:P-loop containing nucleoside triphosphate hydrolase protein [Crassisporium funariophilum]|nr:P-loop containing nucleoside triphosphate hydrolase protein [Crassisporium funariophilum]
MAPSEAPQSFQPIYNTQAGRTLVTDILAKNQPRSIEPHDYQLEGICYALDGVDLVATMATGSGKTGFYCFLMLVILAISQDPSIALAGKTFPKNPCMILIAPTKALQQDMSRSMSGFGLKSLVINSDTAAEARESNRNIWLEARTEGSIITLSPEELQNPEFRRLIDHADFAQRICKLGVDEIHLLHWWGKSFRTTFQQIGLLRPRLPLFRGEIISLIGTTATLRKGQILNNICHILGLKPGCYHRILRSNMRHDIQLIFREMHSGIGGSSFPELDWILEEGRNTVIFCKTISLGFRVVCYLWRHAKSQGVHDLEKRIRLFNSLNWKSYNDETLGFLNNNDMVSITIATDVLSVGWDSQSTEDAIILGEPADVDEFVQKIGRIGRNRRLVSHPRGILYYTRGALATAQSLLDNHLPAADYGEHGQSTINPPSKKEDREMDISMAGLLLAECKPAKLNSIYDNPESDPECTCGICKAYPSAKKPVICACSGPYCTPESRSLTASAVPTAVTSKKTKSKRGEGLNKELRALGTQELKSLRQSIFNDASASEYGFFPPSVFLPDETIKELIDKLYSVQTISDEITSLTPGKKNCYHSASACATNLLNIARRPNVKRRRH